MFFCIFFYGRTGEPRESATSQHAGPRAEVPGQDHRAGEADTTVQREQKEKGL